MSSKNHVFQGSCNFMIGSSSLYVTTLKSLLAIGIVVVEVSHHSTNFGGHRYSGGGDNDLVCHVILQNYVIKVACDFIGRSLSK